MSSVLYYHHDENYRRIYEEGLQRTGMPDSDYRRPRFYNLVQMFMATSSIDGACLEAGCFKGLSSFLLCSYSRLINHQFKGEGFSILDSFEGLSEPSKKDLESLCSVSTRAEKQLYTAAIDQVRKSLSAFPGIILHKGWIPEILSEIPERKYRFVHIDLDLYDPIIKSLEYFYPRLLPGGILVIDDYGYLDFPGAKKAVDEFCEAHRLQPICLTTGNAALIKFGVK